MNKTIMFLGMLAVSFANAQQGNVGVNTNAPKATLEVQPTATNLAGTTNEGIIAPKLSKTRVADIAVPVEGTLVYVTNEAESLITAYTGTDVKVAKIDEKGYYYFDGTEWVKAKNVVQDQEWVYDNTTKRINLRRSGDTAGTFKNKIFYNAETGQYVDIDDENNIRGVRLVTANRNVSFEETTETLSKDAKYKNFIHSESKNLHPSISISSDGKVQTTYKQLGSLSLVATEDDNTDRMYTTSSNITIPSNNKNNFVAIYGDGSSHNLFGTGNVNASYGQSGQVSIGNSQNVKSYITGLIGTSAIATSGIIEQAFGVIGRNFIYSAAGANITRLAAGSFTNIMPLNDNSLIKQYAGILTTNTNSSQNSGTGQYIAGVYNIVEQKGKTKYPNMYGIFTNSIVDIAKGATAPDNHYGLYVNDVQGGAVSNYAIHTGLGDIRFGQLKGNNNRLVVANSNGVLSTDINNELTSKWTTSVNNTIKLKYLSDNTSTRGTLENLFIKDNGYIGVGTSTPIARLDIAERVFIDSWNIANGVAIRAFKTPWARGYNFISEDKSSFLGGLQAYSSNGDEINYFSIGSDHINKTIVKFYPDTFNTHFRGSIGVGIEAPTEKLEVAGAIKVANSTDNTCDTTKAGTIRFVAETKKFQGCTGTGGWVDLH